MFPNIHIGGNKALKNKEIRKIILSRPAVEAGEKLGFLPGEMKDKLNLRDLPDEDFGNFHTLGGFVLNMLGRIPKKGEFFEYADWRFEVVDVDHNRVDEVLATPVSPTADKPL